MTLQPSRRAFLTGGRLFGGPWGRFCHRLGRLVKGRFEDRSQGRDDPGTGWLAPVRREDVYHARALCAEMNVQLALAGSEAVVRGPALWVHPAPLRALEAGEHGAWRCEPGTPLGELRTRGLCPGAEGSDDEPVILWLSRLRGGEAHRIIRGESGLEAAEVLLFDGQSDRLARFGAATRRAPLGAALRDVISESFRLAQRADLQRWRQADAAWPARYRLDALWRDEPNLAHLLAGSQGTLAWAEILEWHPAEPVVADAPTELPPRTPADAVLTAWIEENVKQSFDPQDVLPRLPPLSA